MGHLVKGFDQYVVDGIISNNPFCIKEIANLHSITSRFFDRHEYALIAKMIQEKKIDDLKNLTPNNIETGEYLEIMSFDSDGGGQYIVTVYDSDALEQDPQIIEIFELLSRKQ